MTTSDIQTAAKQGVEMTATGSIGSAQFGKLRLEWGYHNFTNLASEADGTYKVTFTKSFKSSPAVMTTPSTWLARPTSFGAGISTTGFTLGGRHAQGSKVTMTVSWLAVGETN